ncbi:phosphatase PAP2 family protein [Priestia koreensis]|uniref:phosphatase PAP2 family protein n=1 Tax=Priestia koreensis TaxID=284581 RepID=UPI00301AFFAA
MKKKIIQKLYELECQLFRMLNRHFDRKFLSRYFRFVTHFGGALLTIAIALLLMIFTSGSLKLTAYAGGLSLALSHVPVAIMKKLYPRKRPYLQIKDTKVLENPLTDHSFPSGHTTAIFSLTTPFFIYFPFAVIILLPLACSVGLSRIFLGLHYPTDVLVGSILGTCTGLFCFSFFH